MPRRREIPKRELPADPVYNSTLVSKFINTVMSDGKRSTAERILYQSFDIIKERSGDDPLKVFKKALDNVKPSLEVKSRRVGGSNYQVPVEVNPNRRLSLSIRWLVGYARERGDGKTMQEKLANELMDAANLRGGAVKVMTVVGTRPELIRLSLVFEQMKGAGIEHHLVHILGSDACVLKRLLRDAEDRGLHHLGQLVRVALVEWPRL